MVKYFFVVEDFVLDYFLFNDIKFLKRQMNHQLVETNYQLMALMNLLSKSKGYQQVQNHFHLQSCYLNDRSPLLKHSLYVTLTTNFAFTCPNQLIILLVLIYLLIIGPYTCRDGISLVSSTHTYFFHYTCPIVLSFYLS